MQEITFRPTIRDTYAGLLILLMDASRQVNNWNPAKGTAHLRHYFILREWAAIRLKNLEN